MVLKTSAFGLGFQHLPRDLANVNAWKTMFDPYIIRDQTLFFMQGLGFQHLPRDLANVNVLENNV